MRNLRHTNINSFLGACIDPGHVAVVTSYCGKGSLQDVLGNDSLNLDWMFGKSFIMDIVQVNKEQFYFIGGVLRHLRFAFVIFNF